MQFCPECNYMVYTKLQNMEEDPELINYCKNCAWTGKLKNDDKLVYKRSYEKDYIVHEIYKNKYTIFDNALPRLKIDCINDNCITNIDINIENSFIINNIPENYEEKEIEFIFDEYKQDIEKKIRVRLCSVVVETTNKTNKTKLMKLYDNKELDGEIDKLEVVPYKKPIKEILYIKYDPENMKFLYMCANCGSSWIGNN